MPATEFKEYGQYIVADPRICHGKLTFRGTRIFVQDVLEDVARGMDWDEICRRWHGSVSHEAIAEAIRVAKTALLETNREEDMRVQAVAR
jgi:uncharacterized protein (DUF433 family)